MENPTIVIMLLSSAKAPVLLSYLAAIIKAVCICLAEPDLYILKESWYLIWSNEKDLLKSTILQPL